MELNNSLNNIMKNLHNVAIHEAGHAVADCVLGHGLTPQGIELSRFDDERFEGVVYATPTTQTHVTASLPPSLARLQSIARQGR
jgi:hypothetical protein